MSSSISRTNTPQMVNKNSFYLQKYTYIVSFLMDSEVPMIINQAVWFHIDTFFAG